MDANDWTWSSRNYLLCSVVYVYVDYKGKEKSDSGRCDGLDVTNMTNRYRQRLHSAQSAQCGIRARQRRDGGPVRMQDRPGKISSEKY